MAKVSKVNLKLFKLMEFITRKLGYRLYNHSLYWYEDDEFRTVWKNFVDGRRTIPERRFTLYSIAKSVASIPEGDTCECGTFRGGSSHLIMSATNSTHHIFDSFEGLSHPGELDVPVLSHAYSWKKADLACSMQVVDANLKQFKGRYHLYKGWIPERFSEVQDKKFKLVHIDVDLYDPTKDTLVFFAQKMVQGGIIICDDYGSTICPGAKQACDEVAASLGKTVISLTTGQGLLVF